jgi:hypothetical protein
VVPAHAFLVLGQRGPQLGGLLLDVGEDAVEPSVGGDELGCRLLPHPGHTGQVVAGVASERGVLRVLGRTHPGALADARLVVQRVVADAALVVHDPYVRVLDQLVRVAVARDDDHVMAPVTGLCGQCGQQVVGLPARRVQGGDTQRVEDLAHQPHLLVQDVGRRLALGLVLRFQSRAGTSVRLGRRPR